MDWARPGVEAPVAEAVQKVTEKKDETRTAKRVRRREQQKVAQQRYRCATELSCTSQVVGAPKYPAAQVALAADAHCA